MLIHRTCHICRHVLHMMRFILINVRIFGTVMLSKKETFFYEKDATCKTLDGCWA